MDSPLQFLCGLAFSISSALTALPSHPEDGGPVYGAADTAKAASDIRVARSCNGKVIWL